MNRPYVFCHMMTSLDGKIMGNYMETPEGSAKEQAPLWHSQCQKGACSLLYGLIFQSAVVAAEGKIVLHLPTQYKLCVFQRPVVQ